MKVIAAGFTPGACQKVAWSGAHGLWCGKSATSLQIGPNGIIYYHCSGSKCTTRIIDGLSPTGKLTVYSATIPKIVANATTLAEIAKKHTVHTVAVPTVAVHTVADPTVADHTVAVPTAADHMVAVPTAADHPIFENPKLEEYCASDLRSDWANQVMMGEPYNSVCVIFSIRLECDNKSEHLKCKPVSSEHMWYILYSYSCLNQWLDTLGDEEQVFCTGCHLMPAEVHSVHGPYAVWAYMCIGCDEYSATLGGDPLRLSQGFPTLFK